MDNIKDDRLTPITTLPILSTAQFKEIFERPFQDPLAKRVNDYLASILDLSLSLDLNASYLLFPPGDSYASEATKAARMNVFANRSISDKLWNKVCDYVREHSEEYDLTELWAASGAKPLSEVPSYIRTEMVWEVVLGYWKEHINELAIPKSK